MPSPLAGARRRTPGKRRRITRKARVSRPVKTYVKKAITATKESNYFPYAVNGTELNYDGQLIAELSTVPQGDDISSREGDRIEPTSFILRGSLQNMATTTVARLVLVQWRPDSSQEPLDSISDCIQNSTLSYGVYGNYVPDKRQRMKFKVLWDRTFVNTTGATQIIPFNVMVTKFANKYINYGDSVTTAKSHLYLLGYSNVAVASSGPTIIAQGRLRWKE